MEGLAIRRLQAYGIVTGSRGDGGDLRLQELITRAELAKLLVVGSGWRSPPPAAEPGAATAADPAPSTDVTGAPAQGPPNVTLPPDVIGHWAEPYVAAAWRAGILAGYPDGRFNPAAPPTYGEVATALARALGLSPVAQLSWPQNYVEALRKAGGIPPGLPVEALQGAPAVRGPVFLLTDYALAHVRDATGRTTYQRVHDSEPPVIEWIEQPPARTREDTLTLQGRVAGGFRVWVGGEEVPLDPDGRFSASVALQAGPNRVQVVAVDLAGNRTEQTVTVTRS
ncbi:S-layer homology domain-containing protein [Caldinitratiruptor microaerophilus]|uniref:S-layer homology domain-containing protein n=1 Tax=Caldinitratiruptor microaerophilus TaxID=671077 RepID=UPI002230F9F6|nr:S-layer homology domain-containing protein [Caldinitratiruptor microaerophilus]